ncbi:MAG: hypothetical protein JSV39_00865, partial [Candidatus Aenigmatarchaeota archaeon]
SIDIKKNKIMVNLKVSKSEYELLGHNTSNLLLLPTNLEFLNRPLTTGKLGNSNRVMLPKKILERYEIKILEKKVPARAFGVHDEIFLLIRLKKSGL